MQRYLQEIVKNDPHLRIDVLTIRQAEANAQFDPTVAVNLPSAVRVHRVNPGTLYRHRFAWDLDTKILARDGWLAAAPLAAVRLGNIPWIPRGAAWIARRARADYDGIYVFADPLASITLGILAASLNPRARLVLEYGRGIPPLSAAAASLEKRALSRCAAAVVRTRATVHAYQARYPSVPPERFKILYGGVDWSDYHVALSKTAPTTHFSIVYTGTIYADSLSPRPFLEAVARIAKAGLYRVSVTIVGASNPVVSREVDDLALGNVVNFAGHVGLDKIAAIQTEASLLLAIGFKSPFKISSKLAQYAAARVPVLYIADSPDDPGASLVSQSGRGLVAPNDVVAIESAINHVRRLTNDHKLPERFDLSDSGQFSWQQIATEIATLLTDGND
ncbi:MAG TPA: glycosyltransferase [Streptosporangiaceae bacterium]|nr:glycosyltransferase [Streptosporangiaceae bacterium]